MVTRGVVFDLDDTLVFERDYVRSGFRHVAGVIAARAGASADEVFDLLWSDFLAGVRGDAFDRALARFPAPDLAVADLVEAYRAHEPDVQLAPGAEEVLAAACARGTVAIVSDGPLASQRAKVAALGLASRCAPVVLTDAWGKEFWKPHRRAFEHVAEAWGLAPEDLVYVGDNPLKDFVAPNELGWHTMRLRVPEQLRHALEPPSPAHAPKETIDSLNRVVDWLDRRR